VGRVFISYRGDELGADGGKLPVVAVVGGFSLGVRIVDNASTNCRASLPSERNPATERLELAVDLLDWDRWSGTGLAIQRGPLAGLACVCDCGMARYLLRWKARDGRRRSNRRKRTPMLGQNQRMERDLEAIALAVARGAIGDLVWRGVRLPQALEAHVPLATLGVIGWGIANRRHARVPQDIGLAHGTCGRDRH
jgi:hypothetical protein